VGDTSCRMSRAGARSTTRASPPRVTAHRDCTRPRCAAVNQTSRPAGCQASPQALLHPGESVFNLPERSTTAIEPPSSVVEGWSMKATRSPRGETRALLIQPAVS
jgi:hypothetical protein